MWVPEKCLTGDLLSPVMDTIAYTCKQALCHNFLLFDLFVKKEKDDVEGDRRMLHSAIQEHAQCMQTDLQSYYGLTGSHLMRM